MCLVMDSYESTLSLKGKNINVSQCTVYVGGIKLAVYSEIYFQHGETSTLYTNPV
jgi:hypothetical protein